MREVAFRSKIFLNSDSLADWGCTSVSLSLIDAAFAQVHVAEFLPSNIVPSQVRISVSHKASSYFHKDTSFSLCLFCQQHSLIKARSVKIDVRCQVFFIGSWARMDAINRSYEEAIKANEKAEALEKGNIALAKRWKISDKSKPDLYQNSHCRPLRPFLNDKKKQEPEYIHAGLTAGLF